MDIEEQPAAPKHELIGGPFSVLESDPGVFTTLIHRLGAQELNVVEAYSVTDLDRIQPHAVILCCQYGDVAIPKDVPFDPDARELWFAQQLSDNACATTTILNVLLNCQTARIGANLKAFKHETREFDPLMKGLAISSSSWLRGIHNSAARACDMLQALHNLSHGVTKSSGSSKSRGSKKRKTSKQGENSDPEYHYIGYVHCHDHAWEIDGLSNGPIDLGRTDMADCDPWIELVMQALNLRMSSNGTSAGITFSLLGIVDSKYTTASDRYQALKREKRALERRMREVIGQDWENKVEAASLAEARRMDAGAEQERIFSPEFGSKNLEISRHILGVCAPEELVERWQRCVQSGWTALGEMERELERSRVIGGQIDSLVHDYTPFMREYVRSLQQEGELGGLGLDAD